MGERYKRGDDLIGSGKIRERSNRKQETSKRHFHRHPFSPLCPFQGYYAHTQKERSPKKKNSTLLWFLGLWVEFRFQCPLGKVGEQTCPQYDRRGQDRRAFKQALAPLHPNMGQETKHLCRQPKWSPAGCGPASWRHLRPGRAGFAPRS